MVVSGNRSEVRETLPEEGSYQKGSEVIGQTPDGMNMLSYDIDGPLYRGVSLEDYERIKEQGFIDTDMRGAISEHEGMNFATNRDTALEYIPKGEQGVVLAIDPKDANFWGIEADDYPRTNDPIPISSVTETSNIMDKKQEETNVHESTVKNALAMGIAAIERARETGNADLEEKWMERINERLEDEFPEDQATQDRIWQEAQEDRENIEENKRFMD